MEYVVCVKVEGYAELCVEASNVREASEKACKMATEHNSCSLMGTTKWARIKNDNDN